MDPEDETLGEVAEESPRAALAAVSVGLGDDDLTKDHLISLVVTVAREEDLNLPRLVNEQPEAVEELWGRSIQFDEHVVEMVDEALDGRVDALEDRLD